MVIYLSKLDSFILGDELEPHNQLLTK